MRKGGGGGVSGGGGGRGGGGSSSGSGSTSGSGSSAGSRGSGAGSGTRGGTRYGGVYGAGAGINSGRGFPYIAPIAVLPFLGPHPSLEARPMPGSDDWTIVLPILLPLLLLGVPILGCILGTVIWLLSRNNRRRIPDVEAQNDPIPLRTTELAAASDIQAPAPALDSSTRTSRDTLQQPETREIAPKQAPFIQTERKLPNRCSPLRPLHTGEERDNGIPQNSGNSASSSAKIAPQKPKVQEGVEYRLAAGAEPRVGPSQLRGETEATSKNSNTDNKVATHSLRDQSRGPLEHSPSVSNYASPSGAKGGHFSEVTPMKGPFAQEGGAEKSADVLMPEISKINNQVETRTEESDGIESQLTEDADVGQHDEDIASECDTAQSTIVRHSDRNLGEDPPPYVP